MKRFGAVVAITAMLACVPAAVAADHAFVAQAGAELVLAQAAVDAAPAEAPSLVDNILSAAFSPGGIAVLVGLIGSVLGLVFGSSEVRKRRLALGVYHAYHIVDDIDAERGDATLDKPKEGLRALDDWMKANGWRPLKPGEEKAALLQFQALHGAEKQAVKIQAEAQAQAATLAGKATAAAVVPQMPLAGS